MAGKIYTFQGSFAAGELSPHLFDRIDLDAYYAGATILENFIPLQHGPIMRRRGSKFIAQAPSTNLRLVPFSFNIDQTFVLEFSPNKLRVYVKDGLIANTAGTGPFEVATPWTAKDLPKLGWAQNGDWLFVCCGRLAPHAVKRYGNQDWRVEPITFTAQPTEWGGNNWPTLVSLFEQRAYYAATPLQPQQVWASRTGQYENFTYKDGTTVNDDNAFTYTIFSDDSNGIVWMLAMATLVIGTSGAEFRLGATSAIDPITPKNITIQPQTAYGSSSVRPVRIGTTIIFAPRSTKRIRTFEYSFTEDQYTANDLTVYASHVLEGRVKEMSVQSAPDSYIWIITQDGKLVGCTYEKEQKVLAWHSHNTQGTFKNICMYPTRGNDVLFVAVDRKINGQAVTYVEILEDAWEPAESVETSFYVDSGRTYTSNEPKQVWEGFSHLEGMEVQVLCDGWIHPPVVVQNGTITLQQNVKRVTAGLSYTSEFQSVVPQAQESLTMGQKRRISEAVVALEDSINFEFGVTYPSDKDHPYEEREAITIEGPTPVMNEAVQLFSQHRKINVESNSARTTQLRILQRGPLPLIVRGIVYGINPSGV